MNNMCKCVIYLCVNRVNCYSKRSKVKSLLNAFMCNIDYTLAFNFGQNQLRSHFGAFESF